MKTKLTDWIGFEDKTLHVEYNETDVALYNLSIGAKKNDVRYFYPLHTDFTAVPTYMLVTSFMKDPETGKGSCPSLQIQDAFGARGLDWDQDLYINRPINPHGGRLTWNNVVENIYDRGEGKGVVISNRQDIYDQDGRHAATGYVRTVMFGQGGFGGEPVPKNPVEFPEREPDFVVDDRVEGNVHILYAHVMRCITAKPIHIDADYAKRVENLPDAIVQGHLTLGFACRIAVGLVIPNEEHRLKHIGVQFRNPLFPDTSIRFEGWKMEDHTLYFRVVNTENGKVILNKGIFEWE